MTGNESAASEVLKCESAQYDAQIRQDEGAVGVYDRFAMVTDVAKMTIERNGQIRLQGR